MVNRPLGELGGGSDATGGAGRGRDIDSSGGASWVDAGECANGGADATGECNGSKGAGWEAGTWGKWEGSYHGMLAVLKARSMANTTLAKEAQLFEPSREMQEQSFVIQNALDSDQIIMEHGFTWLKSKKRIQ